MLFIIELEQALQEGTQLKNTAVHEHALKFSQAAIAALSALKKRSEGHTVIFVANTTETGNVPRELANALNQLSPQGNQITLQRYQDLKANKDGCGFFLVLPSDLRDYATLKDLIVSLVQTHALTRSPVQCVLSENTRRQASEALRMVKVNQVTFAGIPQQLQALDNAANRRLAAPQIIPNHTQPDSGVSAMAALPNVAENTGNQVSPPGSPTNTGAVTGSSTAAVLTATQSAATLPYVIPGLTPTTEEDGRAAIHAARSQLRPTTPPKQTTGATTTEQTPTGFKERLAMFQEMANQRQQQQQQQSRPR